MMTEQVGSGSLAQAAVAQADAYYLDEAHP